MCSKLYLLVMFRLLLTCIVERQKFSLEKRVRLGLGK